MADNINLQVKLVPDTKELERVLKDYNQSQVDMKVTSPDAGDGGEGGGFGVASLKIAAILGTAYAIKKGIDQINDSVDKIVDDMAKVNPAFAKQQELFSKMYNMALLPISQLMNMMMKPYLQLMLVRMRAMREEAAPLLEDWREASEVGDTERQREIQDEILDLYKQYSKEFATIQWLFTQETKGIAAEAAGYRQAMEIIWNNWLTATEEWLKGFLDGLSGLDDSYKVLEEVTGHLHDAIKEGEIDISTLTPDLRDAYKGYEEEIKRGASQFEAQNKEYNSQLTILGYSINDVISAFEDAAKRINQVSFVSGAGEFIGRIRDRLTDTWDIIEDSVSRSGPHYTDFISRPGQPVQSFSPSDTIVGMKDISNMGGQGITVNISVNGSANRETAEMIKKELVSALARYGRF
jgi:uncharacterized phage infection (PIP) family protein YhgE